MAHRKIRYAVVGLGNIAQVAVLPAFVHARGNSELVALVSSDRLKRKRLGKRYRVERVGGYDELEQIIAEESIHAVYIALPNSLHCHFTERAAAAGAHVLCEKPMAMNEAECRTMIGAAKANDVKLMIAYRLHFEAANLRAIELARAGKIGDVKLFSSIFSHRVRPSDIRNRAEAGGGALYDMGVYCINAARYLFQAEPIAVQAFTARAKRHRMRAVDQTTTVIMRFPKDRVAQFIVSQEAGDVSSYEIVGTRGRIKMDPGYDYSQGLTQVVTIDDKSARRNFPKSDQFAPELVYFSRCVLDGLEPEPSGEEGLADVRVVRAILEAAENERVIELPRFTRHRRPRKEQAIARPAIRRPETIHAPSPSL